MNHCPCSELCCAWPRFEYELLKPFRVMVARVAELLAR